MATGKNLLKAKPHKSPADITTNGLDLGSGDVPGIDPIENANPQDKSVNGTQTAYEYNRQMGIEINEIVRRYNRLKHGEDNGDALLIEWRLWPNSKSKYTQEYGYKEYPEEEEATKSEVEEQESTCGCGCG